LHLVVIGREKWGNQFGEERPRESAGSQSPLWSQSLSLAISCGAEPKEDNAQAFRVEV